MERTYAMLKPGVLQRRLSGEIIARLERKGLKLVAMKLMVISQATAKEHYKEHEAKPFFGELISFITSGPVVAMVWEGDAAISMVRKLAGATKSEESLPGTIRGDFALHTALNVIHASDSTESAAREIGLFFSPDEIHAWEDGNDAWI
jgi:nucleoside-diphosphate kinase